MGARSRSQLVAFISFIAMLGIVFGVALLIVVLSVMNGFDYEMRHRILALIPPITITAYGDTDDGPSIEHLVEQHIDVTGVAPFIQLNGLLLRGTDAEVALVVGIDPKREQLVSIMDQFVTADAWQSLQNSNHSLLGSVLAERLQVNIGDRVTLLFPEEQPLESGEQPRIKPRFIPLTVSGIIDTDTELDQHMMLVPMPLAQSLVGAKSEGFRLSITDLLMAPRVARELNQMLPATYHSRDWTQTYGNLYEAIQLSRRLVSLMLLTIIIVAAFNVIAALVMVVMDKRADIAILRTLGAQRRGIMGVFIMQGSGIGILGTVLGVVFGSGLALGATHIVRWIERFTHVQFLNTDVYPISYLPSVLQVSDIVWVGGMALLMSVLASVYPAWRAANVQPAAALRYE